MESKQLNLLDDVQMNDDQNSQNGFVTLKELAQILDVSEYTIRTTAKLEGVQGTLLPFKTTGGTQKKKVFNEKEATIIKLHLQKSHNLKSRQIDNVSTSVEEDAIIQKAVLILQQRAKRLEEEKQELIKKVEEQQSKVEFYNAVVQIPNGTLTMEEAAKLIGIGRNKLFSILRNKKVLKIDNLPYQNYMKYFAVVEKLVQHNKRKVLVPLVNQKGLDFLVKLVGVKNGN